MDNSNGATATFNPFMELNCYKSMQMSELYINQSLNFTNDSPFQVNIHG